jgi:hypothetical protein
MIPSDIAYSTNAPRAVGESQPRHSLHMAGVVAAMQDALAERRRQAHCAECGACLTEQYVRYGRGSAWLWTCPLDNSHSRRAA